MYAVISVKLKFKPNRYNLSIFQLNGGYLTVEHSIITFLLCTQIHCWVKRGLRFWMQTNATKKRMMAMGYASVDRVAQGWRRGGCNPKRVLCLLLLLFFMCVCASIRVHVHVLALVIVLVRASNLSTLPSPSPLRPLVDYSFSTSVFWLGKSICKSTFRAGKTEKSIKSTLLRQPIAGKRMKPPKKHHNAKGAGKEGGGKVT